MANLLWTDASVEELSQDFAEIISKEDAVILLKIADDTVVGFAQCLLRYDYVEGTESSPVGYLEGIFVDSRYRKRGYAKELLSECERGHEKKTVWNLQVIVNWKMNLVLRFIKP